MKKHYFLTTISLVVLLFGTIGFGNAQTVIQPNSTGIVWTIGNTYNITWSGNAATPYDLYYNKGGAGKVAIATGVSGNTYSWTIPSITAGTDYKVEIWDSGSSSKLDDSNNNFELTTSGSSGGGTIHVNQPNVTGIVWNPGSTYGIYWNDNIAEPVKLELWHDNGSGTDVLYSGATASGLPTSVTGTGYNWSIPAGLDQKSTYKIKVVSTLTTDNDFSDNAFTITSSPSGGSTVDVIQPNVANLQWESGTSHLISWDDDLIENVKLILYVESAPGSGSYGVYSGSPASGLPTSVSGSTYSWAIPATLGNANYKIRIESITSSGTNDISDNAFEVTDSPTGGTYVDLIQPSDVSGLQWISGNTYVISWMDDLFENVKLELWYDNGGTWQEYTSQASGLPTSVSGTTTTWTIPAAGSGAGKLATGTYKIRVESTDDNTIFNLSTNTFEITDTPYGGTYIDVIQPNISGIVWKRGTTQVISWMDDLIEDVKIELYTSANVLVAAASSGIPASTYSGTTYNWTIPSGLATGNYYIKIYSSASGSSVTDQSANNFSIVDYTPSGQITVIQPNGAEQWIHGNSYLISWTDNFSENVKIEVTDGTNGYQTIAASVAGTNSTWTWNTQANWPAAFGTTYTGTAYKVKVTAANPTTLSDESDVAFSFVETLGGTVDIIQPNGGEEWVRGNSYLISWDDNLVENVYIKLYKGSVLQAAATSGLPTYASGDAGVAGTTHSWTIPSGITAGTDYKIRVESIYGSSYFDLSTADFTIAATATGGSTIDILQPNGGESWALNTTHLISWNDDVIENVDIDLYDNQATPQFIAEIANNVVGSTYSWTISSSAYGVGTYKVRIYSTVSPSNASDYSNAAFTITTNKAPSIENIDNIKANIVLYPNPTSTQFTVSSIETINKVEVRNLLGQMLYTDNVNEMQTRIDVSNFESGMYIVNIHIQGEIITKKIFVQ